MDWTLNDCGGCCYGGYSQCGCGYPCRCGYGGCGDSALAIKLGLDSGNCGGCGCGGCGYGGCGHGCSDGGLAIKLDLGNSGGGCGYGCYVCC